MKEITIGMTATATTTVTDANTAKTIKSGNLPVFATPAQCALMEEAAQAAVAPVLDPGEGTVGIHLDITHDATSPVGSTITATATVTAVAGRKIIFSVSATDDHEQIGQGVHTRFVIDEEKFMSKVNKKN